VIYARDVVSAKEDLSARLTRPPPSVDEDGDASWGPVVVCAATTWGDFERWLDVNQGRLRRWVFEPLSDGTDRGRVVIYSLPSFVHEDTSASITQSIIKQVQRAGNDIDLMDSLRTGGQPTCRTGDHGQEPDSRVTPVDLAVGGAVLAAVGNFPFPNVIVEIAYKNDSLPRLRAKLERWMDPAYSSVQVAIGVKIFPGPVDSRRVAILHRRGEPIEEVEFGLHQARPAPLTITFPLGAIYFGVALPPSLAGHERDPITIDLIALRGVINVCVQRELDAQGAAA
jgi:hypothetical protein